MGYRTEHVVLVGAELELVRWKSLVRRKFAAPEFAPDSLQARFADGSLATSVDIELPFAIIKTEEGYDSRVGNPSEYEGLQVFGGYAGFDLSGFGLVEQGKLAGILPELAAAVAQRLTALGRRTETAAVELRQFEITV